MIDLFGPKIEQNKNLIGRPAASTGKAVTFEVNSPGAFPEK